MREPIIIDPNLYFQDIQKFDEWTEYEKFHFDGFVDNSFYYSCKRGNFRYQVSFCLADMYGECPVSDPLEELLSKNEGFWHIHFQAFEYDRDGSSLWYSKEYSQRGEIDHMEKFQLN